MSAVCIRCGETIPTGEGYYDEPEGCICVKCHEKEKRHEKGQSYSQQVNAGKRPLTDEKKPKPGKRTTSVFENTPPTIGAGSKGGK